MSSPTQTQGEIGRRDEPRQRSRSPPAVSPAARGGQEERDDHSGNTQPAHPVPHKPEVYGSTGLTEGPQGRLGPPAGFSGSGL